MPIDLFKNGDKKTQEVLLCFFEKYAGMEEYAETDEEPDIDNIKQESAIESKIDVHAHGLASAYR